MADKGLSFLERIGVRLIWARMEKRMSLKRWVPLISVGVLATSTLLRLYGQGDLAATVDSVGATVGITQATPIPAAEVASTVSQTAVALAALVGFVLKLVSVYKKAKANGDRVGWVPPGAAVILLALPFVAGCGGALAQVKIGGDPKPPGVDSRVVESLVCQARETEAAVYISDRGGSRAEITERIERARQDTAGRPGCACREAACIALKANP